MNKWKEGTVGGRVGGGGGGGGGQKRMRSQDTLKRPRGENPRSADP